ncbi:hypothetical protein GLAREA_09576 [Glarea lozoyensis ATCC 20868]|uniref:Uncharacterized protein n=1 Tax=Glarea lozoyensis (strain ATCC 20868 / MF5171) TaxID=1116229 RepID=S3CS03_GLAL2|nr:uncharacterized protein GLAREA_09576 [Glarea lozoyensis ATCC 20868]EPE28455.1 hypothetical protein GLAREA_09576 [Glarea lozoyensis ATCC 20868]
MSTEPQNGSAYSVASTRPAASSQEISSDDAYHCITAHQLQDRRKTRTSKHSNTSGRRNDTGFSNGTFVSPRSPHHHSNGGDNIAYHSSHGMYDDSSDGFQLGTIEYSQSDVIYPAEVCLDESQNPSHPVPTYTMGSNSRETAMRAYDYTSPIIQPEEYNYQSPSDVVYEEVRNDGTFHMPTSPTTQRYVSEDTPEERMRLGLPRFQTREDSEAYYRQSTYRR